MPNISSNLLPLEVTIRTKIIPALTGRYQPNDAERDLITLPARLGCIALANPSQVTNPEFLSSTKITEALKEAIIKQDFQYTNEIVAHQLEAKTNVYKLRREQAMQTSEQLKVNLSHSLKRSMDLAQEEGASSWLTALPIEQFGLHSIRVHFMMQLPSGTTGHSYTLHQPVA